MAQVASCPNPRQLIRLEQRTLNPRAAGSSPARGTFVQGVVRGHFRDEPLPLTAHDAKWRNWQPRQAQTLVGPESRAGSTPAFRTPMPGRPTAGCVDLTHAIEVRILVRQPSLCSSLGRASPPYGEGNPFDPGQRLDALLQPEHPDGRMGRAAGPQPRRLPGCRHQDRAHQRPGAAQERDLRAARQHPAPRAPRPTSTGNRTIVSFMRCSELSREPAYCGGSFCLPGSGRADMAVCRVVATRDRAGRQRRHVRGVTICGGCG